MISEHEKNWKCCWCQRSFNNNKDKNLKMDTCNFSKAFIPETIICHRFILTPHTRFLIWIKSPHCLGLEYQNGAHKIEAQSLNSTTNHHKVVRLTIISFTIFGSVCLFFGHFNLKTLLKWMSFYKWPLFDLFWPLFHRMCVYLSQNLGSDGHFEVLNGSKSWLGKTLWPQM